MNKATLAERTAAIERHLSRVGDKLPVAAADLRPLSDTTDAVVLHLWQAVQMIIDIATALCVQRGLGVPPTYGDSFRLLAKDRVLANDLAERLARAAGFRNLIVHAYADLDLAQVHRAASTGPADLRRFLTTVEDAFDDRRR